MRPSNPIASVFVIAVLAAACGGSSTTASDSSSSSGGSSSGSGGSTSSGSGSGSGSSSGSSGSSSGSSSGTSGSGSSSGSTGPVGAGAKFGTYIAIGDSISAGGGMGPFYNDLLDQNDDTTYPAWKGHDLSTRYPGIMYVKAAQGGAVSGPYNDPQTLIAPQMINQVNGLGHSYPGDVFITMTIGGNDLNYHAGDAVNGIDATDRMKFTANLKAALDGLTAAGRLGSGKVVILEANIYDPSDGMGDFMSGGGGCPQFNVSAMQDSQTFGAWNQIVSDAISGHASADTLLDLHALFSGHGFNGSDNWFFTDCIHPNTKGHQQLRKEAWRLLTGETLP